MVNWLQEVNWLVIGLSSRNVTGGCMAFGGLVTNNTISKQITALAAQVTAIAAGMQTQFAAVTAAQTAQTTKLVALATQQTAQAAQLAAILADVLAILKLVTPVPSKATKITLGLPTVTKKGIIMANFELKNDTVATIGIQTADAGGAVEPYPTGDVFSAVSSNPVSLGAAVTVVSP